MEKLDVMYICDDSFAQIAGISLTSLFENNPSEDLTVTVYLLLVQVSAQNRRRFEMLAQKYHQTIHMLDAEHIFLEITQLNIATYRGSAMTNLRLHFERFIPKSVHRLLYLDCDTIICDSLTEIAHFDMKHKLLGMVLDAYGHLLKKADSAITRYHNAGVLLIDCDKWRKERWQSRIDAFICQNGAGLSHPDQDIYNIVCKEEIALLPIRYNFQPVHRMYSDKLYFRYLADADYYPASEIDAARKRPAIIHMLRVLGSNPWHENSHHPDSPLFAHYEGISFWREGRRIPPKKDVFIQAECLLQKILPAGCFFPISVFAVKIVLAADKHNKY